LLPKLDVSLLFGEKLAQFETLFARFSETKWRRQPEQFIGTTIREEQAQLDLKLLKFSSQT